MKFSRYNLIIPDESLPEDMFLLCNTFSGATFLIDSSLKEHIEKRNLSALEKDTIEQFISANILIENDDIDEARIHSYFCNKEKFDNSVLSLTILLTMGCNLRCIYCYEGAGEVSNESLNDETRSNIFDFIRTQAEYRRSRIVSIWLFGGEPLLDFKSNIPFLEKVQNFCRETDREFFTHIVTNGILCNRENLKILEKLNCQTIQITLDGVKEVHDKRRIYKNGKGSFDEVLAGIKNVKKHYPLCDPIIRINIDKTNVDRTRELLQFLHDERLNSCSLDFGIVKGTTAACASYKGNCFCEHELGDILYKLWGMAKQLGFPIYTNPTRRNMYCGLYSDSSFTIMPNGDLYKCWDFVNEEKHRVARIGEGGQVTDTTYAYFDWMTRNPYEIAECRECAYLPACGGGCVGVSFMEKQQYHASGCYKMKGVLEKQIIERFKGELDAKISRSY